MTHFAPTDEQQAIISAFASGQDVVVEAGAGCGKSSTLRMCSGVAMNRRGLYVAFNRAIADSARETFPGNVHASTAHGLAFRSHGYRFKHRLNGPRMNSRQMASVLGVTERFKTLTSGKLARHAYDTVVRYCHSGDDRISYDHVPFIKGFEDDMDELREIVYPIAVRAWDDLILEDGGKLPFNHDVYLKLFCLSSPRLNYDFILIDEVQDLNPVLIGLIHGQDHAQKISVGDESQSLYSWRGATNALSQMPFSIRLPLQLSFRFGDPIAEVANEWLDLLDASIRLRGNEHVESKVGKIDDPEMTLCRTNAGVVRLALEVQDKGRKVSIVGGADSIRRLALAAIDLKSSKGTSHPELVAFRTWKEVQEYVGEGDAGELAVFVRLVDEYGARKVIDIASATVAPEDADVIVSTTHKSKGLQWPRVRTADDFLISDQDEELRICYVAATRAQNVLDRSGLDEALRRRDERAEKKVVNT